MAPGCQLYLSIPGDFSGAPSLVEAALAAAQAPALLIAGLGDPSSLRALAAAARRHNAAVLLENDYALAANLGLDGVHLRADGPPLKPARDALGADKTVGVDCRLSRNDAMMRAEAGADYIAWGHGLAQSETLDDLSEMIGWWSAIFQIPCVAHLPAASSEAAWRQLVAAGADFIVPGPEIWSEPDTVLQTVERLASYCGSGGARASS